MSNEKDNKPTPEEMKKVMSYIGRNGGLRGGKARASIPGEMSKLGKIGGKARAASLSPERRKEIARNAVAARNAKRNAKKAQKADTNTELLSNPWYGYA